MRARPAGYVKSKRFIVPVSSQVYGTFPKARIEARRPTCPEQYMCSWGYSHGRFWIKFVNNGCWQHGKSKMEPILSQANGSS
jgi:hypothetical protein